VEFSETKGVRGNMSNSWRCSANASAIYLSCMLEAITSWLGKLDVFHREMKSSRLTVHSG